MIYNNFYKGIENPYLEGYEPDIDSIEEAKSDNLLEAAYIGVYETESNYARLMESVGIAELSYYVETGKDIVIEANYGESLFDKARALFKKILEKIASVFKKFLALVNSFILSDKSFVEKYKKVLTDVNTKGFSYKGYEFKKLKDIISTISDAIDNNIIDNNFPAYDPSKSSTDLSTIIDNISDNKEKLFNKIRGITVSKNDTEIESSDYSKELFKYFRNGEDKPKEITTVDTKELMAIMVDYKGMKSDATSSYNTLKRTINDAISSLTNEEKKYSKNIPGGRDRNDSEVEKSSQAVKIISARIEALKTKLNVLQIYNGAYLAALKDRNRQAKSVCVKLITYKPKTESYMESTGFDLFGNVVFR